MTDLIRTEKAAGEAMVPTAALERFSCGLCVIASDGRETRIRAWNAALDEILPKEREKESLRKQAQIILDGGESTQVVFAPEERMDGEERWIRLEASVYAEGTETRVLYGMVQDVSRQKRMAQEARLLQKEKEALRQQYQELILQHYLSPGTNTLVLGHCNITRNRILEVVDHTHSNLLETFSDVRERFFTGLGSLVVEEKEREEFLQTYLNRPSLEAFARGETEVIRCFFIRLPREEQGRYVQFKVNLVETPDTRDVTGILTVTDITEETITDRILNRLSVASYELVADVDLNRDRFVIVSGERAKEGMKKQGVYAGQIGKLCDTYVSPRDRERVAEMLQKEYLLERLRKEGCYSFSYSLPEEKGGAVKMLTVSAIDLRLGRICMAWTDITDSVREQRGLLNMLAYSFELALFVDLDSNGFTMYTRENVLKNLPPYTSDNYDDAVRRFTRRFSEEKDRDDNAGKLGRDSVLKHLEQSPEGYDFVFSYLEKGMVRYKQINVLWGDEAHKTVCMVRADVTDVLVTERRAKEALENALAQAEQANRSKSDFLASMSHDIRTPMNAIMGMTSLAMAHLEDREKTKGYLEKITASSRHLLSLINDVLDMSQIEQAGIRLNCMQVSIEELAEQMKSIMLPQSGKNNIRFQVNIGRLRHPYFMGDELRIKQILINLLSNAFKFTPEGGSVFFEVEERKAERENAARYRFVVRDTGIGMTEEFQQHLFEPFLRCRNVARIEGTGLGLSIAKGLADLMGADLLVESRLHEGTVFTLELEGELPEQWEQIRREEDGSENREKGILNGRCFLVAEDNDLNSEILCELLELAGARAVVEKNGLLAVKAWERAAPQTFDAVLMDIQMPVMNGYEAARMLRNLPREDARRVPVVAMTANAFAEDVQAALDAGMNAHVAKPVDMQLLCRVLETLLDEGEKGRKQRNA